jgi:hypothetical protein
MKTTGPIAFWKFYEEYHFNEKRKETKSNVKPSNPMVVMPLTNQRKLSKQLDGSIPVVAYTCWDEGSMWVYQIILIRTRPRSWYVYYWLFYL